MSHPRSTEGRNRTAKRALLLGAALALAAAACQVLVSSEPPAFTCTGNGASACPEGQRCATKTGQCKTACNAQTCAAQGLTCDEGTQACSGTTPIADAQTDTPSVPDDTGVPDADVGYQVCTTGTGCSSGICADSRLLGTDVGARFCTKLCCKSTDCAPSETCYAGGTGGKYCTPRKLLQLAPAGGAALKGGGAACQGGGECASGRCANSRCVDTCCINADCTNGTSCRLMKPEVTLPNAWYCGVVPAGATGSPGDTCSQGDSKCKSNLCEGSPPGSCLGYCSRDSQCEAIGDNYCTLYKLDRTEDRFPFCVQTTFGDGPGVSCTNDAQCASSLCETKCARICQVDADCLAGQSCKPRASGTPLTRCVSN